MVQKSTLTSEELHWNYVFKITVGLLFHLLVWINCCYQAKLHL